MSLASSASTYGLMQAFSPSDQELFSLFLRYPEIDTDQDRNDTESDNQRNTFRRASFESSPASTGPVVEPDVSVLIDRHASYPALMTSLTSKQAKTANKRGWIAFCQLVGQSNLPDECLRYYNSLGHEVFTLQAELFGTAPHRMDTKVTTIGEWLLKNVSYSCEQAARQVDIVADLKSLMAFNVSPGPANLCSIYVQRAKLIMKSVALPSKSELTLIQSLVFVYYAYIYKRFLQIQAVGTINLRIANLLNEINDKSMMWLKKYKQWCFGMQELKSRYIKPLIESYSKLSEAQSEFKDFQDRICKARAAVKRPIDDVKELTEKAVQDLNLSARRPGPVMNKRRSKTRYKREHTI